MNPPAFLTRTLTCAIGILGVATGGCVSFNYGPSPFTCSESKECPAGYLCVANRCEIPGTDAASGDWNTSDLNGDSGRDGQGDAPGKGDITLDTGAWFSETSLDSHGPNLNLVINPGFEDGDTGWDLINAMVVSGGNGSPSALELDGNIEMPSRQGSQLISGDPIMGGGFYFFGFQVQASFNNSEVPDSPFSQLEWLNQADVSLGLNELFVDTETDGWQDLKQVFQAPLARRRFASRSCSPLVSRGDIALR